jgi:catechol 2,3-dioxygenase-like lactoylglutathione lyase family enzyme
MGNKQSAAQQWVLGLVATAAAMVCVAEPQDASRLGRELSAVGAEPGANKDGSIPAFGGGEPPTAGWAWGKKRGDYWKHKAEKPLFNIDAANVDKYADKLSPGQVAMVKQTKGYKMDVYPTHRSCAVPDFVAENTRKNVGTAKLNANGWSLAEAVLPGIPFPMPDKGAEVMWNSKMRYRGLAVDYKYTITAASPRKGSDEWIKAGSEQTNFFPWGAKGSQLFSKMAPIENFVYFGYSTPAALAGQALAITIYTEQPTETFLYFPGQRRVRRMPSYAYDAPQIGFENQYTLDEPFVFNGAMDRFDWKLVGKKELYVPYNSFGAYDFSAKFEDVAQKDFIAATHRRYELHRVWVVEATVKPGVRHLAPKRTFYVDEDSWNPVLADDYDGQGKLWKLREGFSIPVFETGACDVSAFVQYNLIEGRYVVDEHAIGTGADVRWITEAGSNPRLKPGFYTSENLRAISDR